MSPDTAVPSDDPSRGAERVAVVTGGGGDIGAAISERLARRGWTVVVCDRDRSAAESVTARINSAGRSAHARRLDVTESTQMEAVITSTAERFGRIGALINNAGISGAVAPLPAYPQDTFDEVMTTNVRSVFLGLRTVLPIMLGAGTGAIVNVASTSGIRGRPNLAGYVASKHAVMGLTKVAAAEVLGTGVRVNAVLPGPIETRMIHAIRAGVVAASDGGDSEVRRSAPAPYGTVHDVAATVDHLVSEDSAHLNGAGIVVDGGSTVV